MRSLQALAAIPKSLPLLLEKSHQTVNQVITDAACVIQSCRKAIAKRGAKASIQQHPIDGQVMPKRWLFSER